MKELITWAGQEYEMEWFDNTDFSKLDNITQVYGVLFNGEKLVIIRPTKERGWRLPGGGIEKGETFEECLIREADEEADIEIDSLVPIGYIKVVPISDNCEKGVHYLLRYIGKITKIHDQTEDIAEGLVNDRKFIDCKEFKDYCDWGKMGEILIEKVKESKKTNLS